MLEDLPDATLAEVFQLLLKQGPCRLERIISHGQKSPSDFWYDQKEDEWVLLLKGSATLAFPDSRFVNLRPGDSLFLPAHQKHRVEKTSLSEDTIWLALFLSYEK